VVGDRWAEWLLERRFGGDSALRDRMMPRLLEFRDRVLDGARIVTGDVVLDVGCGDGLVALGALGRVGPSGTRWCLLSVNSSSRRCHPPIATRLLTC
jgi:hypothetical protein